MDAEVLKDRSGKVQVQAVWREEGGFIGYVCVDVRPQMSWSAENVGSESGATNSEKQNCRDELSKFHDVGLL